MDAYLADENKFFVESGHALHLLPSRAEKYRNDGHSDNPRPCRKPSLTGGKHWPKPKRRKPGGNHDDTGTSGGVYAHGVGA